MPRGPRAASVQGMDPGLREVLTLVDDALAAIAARAAEARVLAATAPPGARRDPAAAIAAARDAGALALAAIERVRPLVAALDGLQARDVHDVVAHGLSLAGVLAGAASATLPTDPARGRRALADLVDAAAAARAELARLAAGAPTLPDLATLARQAGAAGHPIRLHVDRAALRTAPAAVGHSAHRIIQESLTNARRHAPGAPVEVALRVDAVDAALVVDVANGPAPTTTRPGSRRGLAGMHERARGLGGALVAGRTQEGGFRIRARLPL